MAGLLKAGLYLHRKQHFSEAGQSPRPLVSAWRMGLGFLGPLILAGSHPLLAAVLALLGDLIDRGEYYDELAIPTPQADLAARLRVGTEPSLPPLLPPAPDRP